MWFIHFHEQLIREKLGNNRYEISQSVREKHFPPQHPLALVLEHEI